MAKFKYLEKTYKNVALEILMSSGRRGPIIFYGAEEPCLRVYV